MPHEHDAHHVAEVVRAVLAAKNGDPLKAACGLALFAELLVKDGDEAEKTTLALAMFELACQLDPDLFIALRWH